MSFEAGDQRSALVRSFYAFDQIGTIHRRVDRKADPVPTGGLVRLSMDGDSPVLELFGIGGEGPPALRFLSGTPAGPFVPRPGEPGAWAPIDDEDASALHVYQMLDPRILVPGLEDFVSIELRADERLLQTRSDLRQVAALIPPDFFEFLASTSVASLEDRLVELVVRADGTPRSISQPDLPPHDDQVIDIEFVAEADYAAEDRPWKGAAWER